MPDARAGGEQHEHQDDAAERHRAEVWLEEAQAGQDRDHQAVRDYAVPELANALAAADERAGQVEHEGELRELAGLEGERAEGQPAPRTAADAADPGDE